MNAERMAVQSVILALDSRPLTLDLIGVHVYIDRLDQCSGSSGEFNARIGHPNKERAARSEGRVWHAWSNFLLTRSARIGFDAGSCVVVFLSHVNGSFRPID